MLLFQWYNIFKFMWSKIVVVRINCMQGQHRSLRETRTGNQTWIMWPTDLMFSLWQSHQSIYSYNGEQVPLGHIVHLIHISIVDLSGSMTDTSQELWYLLPKFRLSCRGESELRSNGICIADCEGEQCWIIWGK